MCGINGIITASGRIDNLELLTMRDMMTHRGPDGFGEYTSDCGRVGLAHRRLSIIDLSEAASQPMTNEDKTVWVTFNGEIYNYLEMIPRLENLGHRFRSRSDTEVILHAYEEWGTQCLHHFIGMFAFAIWDSTKKLVFLARDHLGIKPLYYYWGPDKLLFASEIKAILRVAPECRSYDPQSIYKFLNFTEYPQNETTFLNHINQLKPGHFILIKPDQWSEPQHQCYWEGSAEAEAALAKYDYRNPVETFQGLFYDSIRLQLRSDVPVGTFLSGGLDSSSIIATISQLVTKPLRAFSAIYPGPAFNEYEWVEKVTTAFGIPLSISTPGPEKLWAEIDKFVWAQEMPTIGPGPFSEYCVAEIAKGCVKVLLNGQGPDELLGGYFHCFDFYALTQYRQLTENFNKSALIKFWRELSAISDLTEKPIYYYLMHGLFPYAESMIAWAKCRIRDKFLTPEFSKYATQDRERFLPANNGRTPLDQYLEQLTLGGPLASLLHYADRNSMAFSIESRVPFLDHRLVEFCLGLPFEFKIRGTTTKYILRKAMEDILPPEVTWRRDKMGFPTPIAQWLRASENSVHDILSSDAVLSRGILKPNLVSKIINAHMRGERDYGWMIWRWLTLELWFQQFVDEPIISKHSENLQAEIYVNQGVDKPQATTHE
jgi:asparagine synthase (glutamine-hydrolysing)